MKIQLSPRQWFRIVRIVIGAFREVGIEVRAAKDPDSDGGTKITTAEAVEIVTAALAGSVEPIAHLIVDATE